MKNCADCKYLIEDRKKDGKVSGCCYYCAKMKDYVNGSDSICDNFEKTYSRKYTTTHQIYKDGKVNLKKLISFYKMGVFK